ncbi:MAG: hypothetical protein K8U57_23120 [Planctomycetes bacterium]|nr:hypothetical protein [Planctomycetota bacterium]
MAAGTAADATNRPTDEQIKAALRYVEGIANNLAKEPKLREAARDASVDAVMWALKKWNPSLGTFVAFAAAAARMWIRRTLARERHRFATRPAHEEITEALPAPDRGSYGPTLPLAVRDLPHDLRDAVNLFYVHKYDLRDIGHLTGTSLETIRRRLQQAAKILGEGDEQVKPSRKTGARRVCNDSRAGTR